MQTRFRLFLYKHPNYTNEVWKDRKPGKAIVRGIGDKETTVISLRSEISKRSAKMQSSKATQLKLSYFRAWISGVFYRAYENEQIGIDPSFYGFVCIEKEGVKYKLDSGKNTQEAKLRQRARDYAEDYQRWKLTHFK